MAVPLEMEHIVMNLVQNAIDAIREKIKLDPNTERKIEVSLKFEPMITFSIKDTGIGIPKTEISKLFDPFYTTKAPGEGTGLGLSIVKDWVQKNHGTIEVDSEKHAWTKIQIMFPYSI
jgi:two-component system NtrC family sensor kinase